MVFEKNLPRRCDVCNGEIEEHEAHKMAHPMVRLTRTGKILPAIVLAAIFILIFAYTLSYAGVEFPSGLYSEPINLFQ